MSLKQYLLFAGEEYYPLMGWRDFKESFDNIDDAKQAGQSYLTWENKGNYKLDWYQIVNRDTGEIIYEHYYEEP